MKPHASAYVIRERIAKCTLLPLNEGQTYQSKPSVVNFYMSLTDKYPVSTSSNIDSQLNCNPKT